MVVVGVVGVVVPVVVVFDVRLRVRLLPLSVEPVLVRSVVPVVVGEVDELPVPEFIVPVPVLYVDPVVVPVPVVPVPVVPTGGFVPV